MIRDIIDPAKRGGLPSSKDAPRGEPSEWVSAEGIPTPKAEGSPTRERTNKVRPAGHPAARSPASLKVAIISRIMSQSPRNVIIAT